MSQWMLAYRATEEAYPTIEPTVAAYLDHWFDMIDNGLPQEVLDEIKGVDLAARDAANRAIIFNRDVDHVWNMITPLIGHDVSELMRLNLEFNEVITELPSLMTSGTNGPILVDTGAAAPSEWQKKIEGTWHGRPSIFDAEGNHVGYEKVARASEFKDGKTLYWMNTKFDGGGALRPRLELGGMFAFGVIDSDQDRIYLGPDFYGAGQPYGSFVDSNYYSPAWQADLVTWNHVLPGTDLQVYSSVCYDGWTPALVFNGVYLRTTDHETNPETQARIEAFMAEEERLGDMSFQLPTKATGAWTGEVEVYTPDQKLARHQRGHHRPRPEARPAPRRARR